LPSSRGLQAVTILKMLHPIDHGAFVYSGAGGTVAFSGAAGSWLAAADSAASAVRQCRADIAKRP